MELITYNTVSNKNVRTKSLTALCTVAVTKVMDVSTVSPTLLVQKFSNWTTCNYAKFNDKYYYVTNAEIYNNSLIRLYLHSDVLANVDLNKVTGVLEKTSSSGKYNVFCNNQTQMFLNQKRFQYFKFSESLPSPSILLTVNGN